jgi:hypothetical protein
MHPWIFYRHSRTPEGEDGVSTLLGKKYLHGFEMRVTRGAFNNRSRDQTTHYTFSTEEQLNRAIQKYQRSVLSEGFKPFMGDSPESES